MATPTVKEFCSKSTRRARRGYYPPLVHWQPSRAIVPTVPIGTLSEGLSVSSSWPWVGAEETVTPATSAAALSDHGIAPCAPDAGTTVAVAERARNGVPFMSVVLCAYNSEAVIARALDSLLAQDYPADLFEVIVVDDASTDRTAEIARRYPVRVVVHSENRGLGSARGTGLDHARGSVFVCFDDDCYVDTDWLNNLAKGYQQLDAAGIGSVV